MIEFDPARLDATQQYKLLSATVVPRPIGLVTTLGPDGPNAAPFSFFNMVAVDPPMVMISCAPRAPGVEKDTIRNIGLLPEFVVHIVDEPNREKMNLCSGEWPYGVNELEKAGFTTAPSRRVRPPRIADCPVQLECRVAHRLQLGRRPYNMVVGEVVTMHYRESLIDPASLYIDVPALRAMGRLEGRDTYVRLTDRFQMARPVVGTEQA